MVLKPSIRKQISQFHLFYCYVNTLYQTNKCILMNMICWLICPYMLAGLLLNQMNKKHIFKINLDHTTIKLFPMLNKSVNPKFINRASVYILFLLNLVYNGFSQSSNNVFPGANATTPSRSQYFSWINLRGFSKLYSQF